MSNELSVKMKLMSKVVLNIFNINVKDEDIIVDSVNMIVRAKINTCAHLEMEFDYTLMRFPFVAIVETKYNIKSLYSAFDQDIESIVENKNKMNKAFKKLSANA